MCVRCLHSWSQANIGRYYDKMLPHYGVVYWKDNYFGEHNMYSSTNASNSSLKYTPFSFFAKILNNELLQTARWLQLDRQYTNHKVGVAWYFVLGPRLLQRLTTKDDNNKGPPRSLCPLFFIINPRLSPLSVYWHLNVVVVVWRSLHPSIKPL